MPGGEELQPPAEVSLGLSVQCYVVVQLPDGGAHVY